MFRTYKITKQVESKAEEVKGCAAECWVCEVLAEMGSTWHEDLRICFDCGAEYDERDGHSH